MSDQHNVKEDVAFKEPTLPPDGLVSPKSIEKEKKDLLDKKGDVKTEPPPLNMSIAAPTLEYDPPPWACEPPENADYKLEVIKNGSVAGSFDLKQRKHGTFVVVGRLPSCDVVLEHPSMSRYHCILQYGEDRMNKTGKGWHMFDMGSTHGSKANRKKMPAKQYIRMQVGWVLNFGLSTRSLTLLGPEEEKEAEWELSPTEMMEQMKKKALERKLAAQAKVEFDAAQKREKEQEERDEGIDWGMDYEVGDSGLMQIDGLDAHLMEDHEAYYNDDPKKALAKFFDREGLEGDFTFSESGANSHNHKWTCTIDLPIDTGTGRAIVASATVSSSKKDAQVQCALEACRILDKHGVLRRSTARAKLKKKTLEDNDFYDEDDDTFFDRTGQIEEQREKRRLRILGQAKAAPKKDTYESLLLKLEDARSEMAKINKKLEELSKSSTSSDQSADKGDSLDAFCAELNKGKGLVEDLKTKTDKSQLRQKLVSLTHDAQRLEKLVKIAKPVALPELKVPTTSSSTSQSGSSTLSSADKQAFMRKMMMMGRKKKPESEQAPVSKPTVVIKSEDINNSSNFVPEEDEDEIPTGDAKGMVLPPQLQTKDESENDNVKDEIAKEMIQEERDKETINPDNDVSVSDVPGSKSDENIEEKPSSTTAVDVEQNKERRKRTLDELKKENEEAVAEAEKELLERENAERKRKRQRVRNREREPKIIGAGDYGEGVEDKEGQYATWLPPENQSGDGTTKLNEKFAGRY